MAETNNVLPLEVIKSFDPNEGAPADGAKLPSMGAGGSVIQQGLDLYTHLAEQVVRGSAPPGTFLEKVVEEYGKAVHSSWDGLVQAAEKAKATAKAIAVPAQFLTYARMAYMPDPTSSNILPWPGVHPEALRKIVAENVAPNIIINQRVDDVLLYAQRTEHLWKPGWRIEVLEGDKSPTSEDKKTMREAALFLANSGTKMQQQNWIEREYKNLPGFAKFLAAITRDSLTFDLLAVFTDRDSAGKVAEYGPVPAGNIRLVGLDGYEGNKDIFAVAVDEGGSVRQQFTREELALYVRNPRTDPEYTISMTRGYGTPEIQTAMKLVQVFQNVIDYNCDLFNRSGVPHGLLLLTGNSWTQRQVDALSRMWQNLKRGISKALALPVVAAPKDGAVEVVDFSRIKGDEALYQDLLNLAIGCFCAVFRFPAHRLHYRVSGHGPDTGEHRQMRNTPGQMVQEADPGLAVLLGHIELFINEVLIWPRWPNMRFAFTGKNPREDAREYEARRNAMTFDEARAEADLPPLEKVVKDPELKQLAKMIGMAPIDPNLSGVFQSVAAAFLKGAEGDGEPGNTMSSSKDPARSEAHGKVSGVRRDSAAESKPH